MGKSERDNAVNTINQTARKRLMGEFFTPKYFVVRAVALALFFFVAHILGLREYTTFLTGTTGRPGVNLETSALLGTIYICLYLGFMVAAPILALAAGLLVVWEMLRRRHAVVNPTES
jgi:hypothetical protein